MLAGTCRENNAAFGVQLDQQIRQGEAEAEKAVPLQLYGIDSLDWRHCEFPAPFVTSIGGGSLVAGA